MNNVALHIKCLLYRLPSALFLRIYQGMLLNVSPENGEEENMHGKIDQSDES